MHTGTSNTTRISSENISVWREQEIKLKWGEKGSRATYIGWHYKDLEEGETIPDSIKASYTIDITDTLKVVDSTSVFVFSMAESTEDSNPKSSGKWINSNKNNEAEKGSSENHVANNELNTNNIEEKNTEKEKDDEKGKENMPKEPIDFSIKMTDVSGEEVYFPLSHFSALQRELKIRVWKSQFITNKDESENIFQTFSYPLEDITKLNASFDSKSIQKIAFIFDKTFEGVIILDNIGFMK